MSVGVPSRPMGSLAVQKSCNKQQQSERKETYRDTSKRFLSGIHQYPKSGSVLQCKFRKGEGMGSRTGGRGGIMLSACLKAGQVGKTLVNFVKTWSKLGQQDCQQPGLAKTGHAMV